MYTFRSLYSVISKLSLVVGFCFPGTTQLHKKLHPFLILYSITSTIPIVYVMVCNLLYNYTSGMYDMKRYAFTTESIVPIFDTFYYLICREEYNFFLDNFDKVTETIMNFNVVGKSRVNYILNRGPKFNSYMKYYVVMVLFHTTISTGVSSYVSRYIFDGKFLFIEIPYSVESEFLFHITAILQTASGLYAVIKSICSWSVMYLFLYHITFYLKTLSIILEDFDSVNKKQQNYNVSIILKNENIFRLRSWIEIHQDIMR